jgi:hypothetical protein
MKTILKLILGIAIAIFFIASMVNGREFIEHRDIKYYFGKPEKPYRNQAELDKYKRKTLIFIITTIINSITLILIW